jgi:hypothetical protein
MPAPTMVPKDLGYRVLELLGSLQVIQDSLQLVRAGRVHQLIPVYGQLRAILRERSRGSNRCYWTWPMSCGTSFVSLACLM